jgi:hypothetical protein
MEGGENRRKEKRKGTRERGKERKKEGKKERKKEEAMECKCNRTLCTGRRRVGSPMLYARTIGHVPPTMM